MKIHNVFLICILSLILVLSGCGKVNEVALYHGPVVSGTLVVAATKQGASSYSVSSFAKNSLSVQSMTNSPNVAAGFIASGPADYLKVTLTSITMYTDQGDQSTVWSGSKELSLTGNGQIVLNDISLSNVPATRITKVSMKFDPEARIKGSITAPFRNADFSSAVHIYSTKAAYPYYATTHMGGAVTASTFEGGSAEETEVALSGGEVNIETPTEYTVSQGATPNLTILFDLSRVLRFYNGKNVGHGGGVDSTDPVDKAYFFCHSVFRYSVAAFFGNIGSVQGYQTLYAAYQNGYPVATGNSCEGVTGWMTLIFDSNSRLLSGMLIGDDDNALTVAKGGISQFVTGNSSLYDMTYTLDFNRTIFTVSGFNLGDNGTTVATFTAPSHHGEAIFTKMLQVP